ncbi:hypothetical protein Ddc_24883 [Ditylenchus destructor]|nr:hypothetical protein Ddc_24883 [Ditylenchus destructor]
MRPYLGPTVRVKKTTIYAAIRRKSIKKRKSVAEMESISYLWRDHKICIRHVDKSDSRIDDKDFQLILYSATILQCQTLRINNAHFSFKDYKILYGMKVIEIRHTNKEEIDLWHQYWQQFLEQPGVKPVVVFDDLRRENIITLLDQLSKDFSSAVSPNTFKIVFAQNDKPLTQFRETNSMSGEILELKKLPVEYQNQCFDKRSYTLERSSI